MEPGFEYLDAELEPAGASVVEVGVDFVRKLRARGDAAKRRPADKSFRDTACSTIPDRDRAHPRIASAKIRPKGEGTVSSGGGEVAATGCAFSPISSPAGAVLGRPEAENR